MNIRKIEQKDIRSVLNIYNWYIENTTFTFETEGLNFAQFRERIKEITTQYPWLVIEENSFLIGYGYLAPFNTRSAYKWTADLSLYLHPDYRNRGYGSLLYKEIEKAAIEQGIVNLVSIVTEQNTASQSFHKKHGFTECGFLNNIGFKQQWLGIYHYLKQIQNPPKELD